MSGKNADVDRAIVAFGGTSFPYQSFGSFGVPSGNAIHTLAYTGHAAVEATARPVADIAAQIVAPPAPFVPAAFHETLPLMPPPSAPAAGPTFAVTFSEIPPSASVIVPAPQPRASPVVPAPDKSDNRSLADMFRFLQARDEEPAESPSVPPVPAPMPDMPQKPLKGIEKTSLFRRI